MDFDFDDLISSDAANNAKASKKFQPKAKPKPKPKSKTPPEPKSVPAPSKQFVETAATANNEPIGRIEEEQIGNDVNHISGNINDDGQSSHKKSQEENAESFLAPESLNDLLPESTTATVNGSPHSKTPNFHVSIDGNLERGSLEPDLINDIDSCTNLESLGQVDPLTGEEATIYNDTGDFLIGNLPSGLKDAESSPLWGSLDILSESKTRSGPKVGKFKPKPKAQTHKVEQIANTPDQQAVENIRTGSSQINFTENESIQSFKPDDLGSSAIKVTDSVPTETIYDFHVNEDPTNLAEISQVDSVNQAGRSSERLKKKPNKVSQLVDEAEDEGTNDDFVHGNEDNNKDGNCGPENETSSEKKGNKSKKSVNEKVKTVRKRKKASEVPSDSNNVAKKKFSHSTKRSKRPVNPEMLKIPEDELEMHMLNFPMRDIIRFAEHRERIAKKDASTSAMNPSSSGLSNHNDKDEEAIAQGGSSHDNSMGADNTTYYNYRTYTKITPRMKWSKQDTELFYEAVQQFGSDLSMIKECFPGRTREQIKSKYKKEERQQPSRLNDALTTRAKGHSHFEVVIERLKQAQAEDSENDDPMNLIGEDDEEGLPTHDIKEDADTKKPVQLEKESKDNVPVAAPESPTKSHDSEDDMFRWSQYKSEI